MNYGIQNEQRFRQANIYDNMLFDRAIRPTDIDGALDFGNRLFVFFEMKSEGAPCNTGQRLFLERITDAISKSGKMCCTFICDHSHPDYEDIICAESRVRAYRWAYKWRRPSSQITLNQAINILLGKEAT
jgi:hypothetical protein